MRFAVLLLAGCIAPAFAQTTLNPDCAIRTYTFTATGTSADIDNTNADCLTWVMDYSAVGFSAISMQLEAAPAGTINAGTGVATAGTYVIWGGTITNGVNPVIISPGAGSTRFTDTSAASTQGYFAAFIHVNVTSVTGTGVIKVAVYGFRGTADPNTTGGGGSGGGCVGTPSNPCIVAGPDAPGAASTKNPVQTAGNDGTDVRAIRTDASGQPIPANSSQANADGLSNTEATPNGAAAAALMARILPYQFNGSTLDRQFTCGVQQAFTLSAGTDVVIATGVAATNIKLCHVDFTGDSAQTVTIRQGTGTTCLTNTATIAGPYPNVAAFAADYQPTAPLHTTVAARDVCLHFGGSVTSGGVAIFAQY
jgi:hypothetical protein